MMKIALLYGGKSPEYAVSLRSAEIIKKHLDKKKFQITTVHITSDFRWFVQEPNESCVEYSVIPPFLSCDVILSTMHGSLGENGSMQGLYNVWNIPYVGADVLASAIGMDKVVAKQLVAGEKITPVVPFRFFNQKEWINTDVAEAITDYPVFVKPSGSGSSIGITRVKKKSELAHAVEKAFLYSSYVLIETALFPVREIEVGVLESLNHKEPPLVSRPGEIVTQYEFYDYKAKYLAKQSTELVIPAAISSRQTTCIQSITQRIFKCLRLRHMARIDFFLSNNVFYFNEVNTLPGFTESSMYPKLWEASSMPLSILLTHLIELALRV